MSFSKAFFINICFGLVLSFYSANVFGMCGRVTPPGRDCDEFFDPYHSNVYGEHGIFSAIQNWDIEKIKALVSQDSAAVNTAVNSSGSTPLFYACYEAFSGFTFNSNFNSNFLAVIELLVLHSSKETINKRDASGRSPIYYLLKIMELGISAEVNCKVKSLIKFLMQNGAVNTAFAGQTLRIVKPNFNSHVPRPEDNLQVFVACGTNDMQYDTFKQDYPIFQEDSQRIIIDDEEIKRFIDLVNEYDNIGGVKEKIKFILDKKEFGEKEDFEFAVKLAIGRSIDALNQIEEGQNVLEEIFYSQDLREIFDLKKIFGIELGDNIHKFVECAIEKSFYRRDMIKRKPCPEVVFAKFVKHKTSQERAYLDCNVITE